MKALFIISISWFLFYLFHSLLALPPIKAKGQELLGGPKNFRLFYSVFSVLTFAIISYLLLILEGQSVLEKKEAITYCGLMISSLGVIVLQKSFKRISIKSFLGLSNEKNHGLIMSGLHAHVRHPIYSGTILIFLGAFLFNPTNLMLTSFVWLLIYLPVGIYLEEKKLITLFGDQYLDYKKRAKAVIPKII